MKRILTLLTVVALALAGLAPVYAGDAAAAGATTLKGWIVDSDCGAKNANASGSQCAKDCIKKGAKAVLSADGKIYKLSDQKLAVAHAGSEVEVTGTVDKDGNIKVEKITPVEAKKTT